MINAFAVLNVERNASDYQIRKAYLELIKIWDPESSPLRFREITEAYEKIKTERARTTYLIFGVKNDAASPFDLLRRHATLPTERKPLSYESMKELLRKCTMK